MKVHKNYVSAKFLTIKLVTFKDKIFDNNWVNMAEINQLLVLIESHKH